MFACFIEFSERNPEAKKIDQPKKIEQKEDAKKTDQKVASK